MAKYRIQRAKGVEGSTIYTYTAPGHNECVPTRLFDVDGGGANDIEGGKMIMGITYFVPGGGCDYGANPLESIYYILTGEMTLKTEDGETVPLRWRRCEVRHQHRHRGYSDAGLPAASPEVRQRFHCIDSSAGFRL